MTTYNYIGKAKVFFDGVELTSLKNISYAGIGEPFEYIVGAPKPGATEIELEIWPYRNKRLPRKLKKRLKKQWAAILKEFKSLYTNKLPAIDIQLVNR